MFDTMPTQPLDIEKQDLSPDFDWVYHSIRQAKYARRYLAEAAYRFNRRFRLREMASRLATAVMACKPCPERLLWQACNFVD